MIREVWRDPLAIDWYRVLFMRGAAWAARAAAGDDPARLRGADLIDELIDIIANVLIERGDPFIADADLLMPVTPDQRRLAREGRPWNDRNARERPWCRCPAFGIPPEYSHTAECDERVKRPKEPAE